MPKWAYKLERLDLMAQTDYVNVEATLTKMGEQGWEMVGVQDVAGLPFVIFKRASAD